MLSGAAGILSIPEMDIDRTPGIVIRIVGLGMSCRVFIYIAYRLFQVVAPCTREYAVRSSPEDFLFTVFFRQPHPVCLFEFDNGFPGIGLVSSCYVMHMVAHQAYCCKCTESVEGKSCPVDPLDEIFPVPEQKSVRETFGAVKIVVNTCAKLCIIIRFRNILLHLQWQIFVNRLKSNRIHRS